MDGPPGGETTFSEEHVLRFLREGDLEVLGLLPRASNATLLARVTDDDVEGLAVYKPRRGESPLWDFPSGTLCLREYAAWLLDRTLGWGLVPTTVLRDGPAGFGAVQLYVDEDPDLDVRRVPETHPDDLQRMVAFDVVANNADRKAGHLLVDRRGKLWSVDHGICFHDEPKLRTVLWVYAGDPLPEDVRADLSRLCDAPSFWSEMGQLLSAEEVAALRLRVDRLLAEGRYPIPGPGRNVPWPPF